MKRMSELAVILAAMWLSGIDEAHALDSETTTALA